MSPIGWHIMSNICQYCSAVFSSKSSLSAHIKSAKYCILLRHTTGCKPVTINYTCEACNKSLSNRSNYNKHLLRCKIQLKNKSDEIACNIANLNTTIENLKVIVENLKVMVECKEEQITYLKKIVDDNGISLNKMLSESISKPSITMIKKQVLNNLKPLLEEEMKEHIPMLTIDYVKQGGAGYAKYAAEHPLKDRIAVSDRARKKLAYKDVDGNIVYDSEGRALSEKLFKVIREKNELIFKEILQELRERIDDAQNRDDFDEADTIIDLYSKMNI